MSSSAPLNQLSASALARRVAEGTATAREAVETSLLRVEAREPELGAWAWLDPEAALAEADRRDAVVLRGPLHGVPIGIKDIMDTADMPTEHGSPIYRGNRPAQDASVVALLRAAGAVILGKTVTTEFAAFTPGKTCNPHNAGHTPGGSSSGSAAAVADFMVPVALGTQTMGSVIRPAAYCGVIGFKPSFGLYPRGGVKEQAASLDTIGLFARSLDDLVAVSAVLARGTAADFDGTLEGAPRIGFYRDHQWSTAAPAAQAALEAAASACASAGATVVEIAAPPLAAEAFAAQYTIAVYELAQSMAYEWNAHRAAISPALAKMIEAGYDCRYAQFKAAQETAERARAWFDGALSECDVWLALSAPDEAPAGLDGTGDPRFNRLWTLLGTSCITLPFGRGSKGLPLGVQVIGRRHHDARAIAAARWIAQRLS